jgi:hypothetical protein
MAARRGTSGSWRADVRPTLLLHCSASAGSYDVVRPACKEKEISEEKSMLGHVIRIRLSSCEPYARCDDQRAYPRLLRGLACHVSRAGSHCDQNSNGVIDIAADLPIPLGRRRRYLSPPRVRTIHGRDRLARARRAGQPSGRPDRSRPIQRELHGRHTAPTRPPWATPRT